MTANSIEMVDPSLASEVRIPEGPYRIAYLLNCYPAISHTFILREVTGLRAEGFEIECISVNQPDRTVQEMNEVEVHEYLSTYYLKSHGIWGALTAHLHGLLRPKAYFKGFIHALKYGSSDLKRTVFGIFYWTEALMVDRRLRALKINHLHVHFATAVANIALSLKAFSAVRLSITVHGPDEFYDVPGQKLIEKIQAANFLVCIGKYARSQLMRLSPISDWGKFHICPLGVDVAKFNPSIRVQEKRPFTILCVGRLTPAKGQHILLEACVALRDLGKDFRVVIIGTGPDEASLKQFIKDNQLNSRVEMMGAQNEVGVLHQLARSDVFVLPSFAEGIPVALMEAMAAGIPCISTRITGIPELIRDGLDGLLVAPSDVLELTEALAMLMEDEDMVREIGLAGRYRVIAEYNLQKNVSRLAQLFKREYI